MPRADDKPEPRVCEAIGSSSTRVTARGDGGAWLASTDRHVGRPAESHELARKWSALARRADLLEHDGAGLFRNEVLRARALGVDVPAFRGRSVGHEPGPTEMGPPPPDSKDPHGRYSVGGGVVLYLCVEASAVAREVTANDGEVLYLQRYILPKDKLRLADFTAIEQPQFANDVLFFAETAVDPKPRSTSPRRPDPDRIHATLEFSQVVAEIVAEHFDGMVLPGVRGDASLRYFNVVVFRPHPSWPSWLDPLWTPVRVLGA